MSNWKEMIQFEMKGWGETWEDVASCTLPEEELESTFDAGFGRSQGAPFTLWTKSRVYFPAVYDGAEWVASVPRNPNGEATDHVGEE